MSSTRSGRESHAARSRSTPSGVLAKRRWSSRRAPGPRGTPNPERMYSVGSSVRPMPVCAAAAAIRPDQGYLVAFSTSADQFAFDDGIFSKVLAEEIRRETHRTLAVIVEQKRQQIEGWLSDARVDTDLSFYGHSQLEILFSQWAHGGRKDTQGLKRIQTLMTQMAEARGWAGVAIIDADANPAFVVGAADVRAHTALIQDILRRPRVELVDLHRSADGAGLAYWSEQLRTGQISRAELVQAALDEITKNYREASLSNVARSYGVSLAYVSECVRAQTGRTYKELLQKHRMETAARLLRRSDWNIQQIITYVGYENTSYFYRLFHERYGQSPREYRRARSQRT